MGSFWHLFRRTKRSLLGGWDHSGGFSVFLPWSIRFRPPIPRVMGPRDPSGRTSWVYINWGDPNYPRDPITFSDDDWGVESPPQLGI